MIGDLFCGTNLSTKIDAEISVDFSDKFFNEMKQMKTESQNQHFSYGYQNPFISNIKIYSEVYLSF